MKICIFAIDFFYDAIIIIQYAFMIISKRHA